MTAPIADGELLVAEVHYVDRSRQGYHYWNRLPDGVEQYLLLRQRVNAALAAGASNNRTGPVTQASRIA